MGTNVDGDDDGDDKPDAASGDVDRDGDDDDDDDEYVRFKGLTVDFEVACRWLKEAQFTSAFHSWLGLN